MIGNISSSNGIEVSGTLPYIPYISINQSNPLQGMVRINGTTFEVFNGTTWSPFNQGQLSIGLDSETKELLEWAHTKKEEENLIEILLSDHPAVKVAKENLNKAKEEIRRLEQQLQATEILSKEYDL